MTRLKKKTQVEITDFKPALVRTPLEDLSPDQLLKPREVATLLRVSEMTLWRWRNSGDGPTAIALHTATPSGRGSIGYPVGALLDWMKQQVIPSRRGEPVDPRYTPPYGNAPVVE